MRVVKAEYGVVVGVEQLDQTAKFRDADIVGAALNLGVAASGDVEPMEL